MRYQVSRSDAGLLEVYTSSTEPTFNISSGQAQSYYCQTAETMNLWGYERRLGGDQHPPYHPLTPRDYDLLSLEMPPRCRQKRRRQPGMVKSSLCLSLMSR